MDNQRESEHLLVLKGMLIDETINPFNFVPIIVSIAFSEYLSDNMYIMEQEVRLGLEPLTRGMEMYG